jgi:hypothetical protein
MGIPLPRRRVLVAIASGAGALGLATACTGSSTPVVPTTAAPTAPDPLLSVLEERARLVEAYDAAGHQHPQLLARLQPLRMQTEEQVLALRLALGLGEPTRRPTASRATNSPSASAVAVDPAVTLEDLRSALRASGSTAAALCETTTAQRAPLVGSLAAAAGCHELLLA